jgi:hypothetical protein
MASVTSKLSFAPSLCRSELITQANLDPESKIPAGTLEPLEKHFPGPPPPHRSPIEFAEKQQPLDQNPLAPNRGC